MSSKKARQPARRHLSTSRSLQDDARTKRRAKYVLTLYVAGVDRKSTQAIRAIAELCDERLKGRYKLLIVDIYQQPRLAREDRIIAAPTLIRKLPLPMRKVVGDAADLDKLLVGLDRRPPS